MVRWRLVFLFLDEVVDRGLQVLFGDDTITVGIEVGEDLVQHLLRADLLKLKLFSPRVHDVLKVLLVQDLSNMRLWTLIATVLVGDELD